MTRTEFLMRPEGRIAYDDLGGSGPLVVCVPAMGDLRSVYRFLAPALSERGFRVVTMDLRGMGESSVVWRDYSESAIASDILALIDHLHAGAATVIGNSISAGAAVCAAGDSPGSVARLVLVGPFVRQVPIPRWQVALFRLLLARPWGAGAWVGYQSKRLYPGTKPQDLAERSRRLRESLHEPGRMKALQRMARTDHRASEAQLGRVSAPTLVVMGTSDPDFPDPRAEADLLTRRLRAKVLLVDGAGHYPQAERPREFLGALLPFLGVDPHGA